VAAGAVRIRAAATRRAAAEPSIAGLAERCDNHQNHTTAGELFDHNQGQTFRFDRFPSPTISSAKTPPAASIDYFTLPDIDSDIRTAKSIAGPTYHFELTSSTFLREKRIIAMFCISFVDAFSADYS
jgi:hypothetical protein